MPSKLVHAVVANLPGPLHRLVRSARIKQAIAGYQDRIITGSFGHGVELTISLQDPLAEGWYEHERQHSLPEIEAARSHGFAEGGIVFDMGAHQAVVALVFADIVGSTGRVIAVEGDRHNVKVAKRNVELNNATNVVIVEAACAAQPGRVSFNEGLNGHVSHGRLGNRVIRAVTIDELANEYGKPDVVVLDIEGFELQALLGARRTLSEGVTFVIEVHAGGELQAAGGTVREIASMLQRHGYTLEYLGSDGWWEADAELVLVRGEELPDSERFFLLGYVPAAEVETQVSGYE